MPSRSLTLPPRGKLFILLPREEHPQSTNLETACLRKFQLPGRSGNAGRILNSLSLLLAGRLSLDFTLTRRVMGQQVPLRLSSDLPPFNWEDFNQNTSLSESGHPLFRESATSDINSLLSARSYPLPESYSSQNAQHSTPSPSPGDFALELASYLNPTNTNKTPLSQPTTPRPQKRQRRGPQKAAPSAKNRGAPREDGDSNENPEEVCRLSIDVF